MRRRNTHISLAANPLTLLITALFAFFVSSAAAASEPQPILLATTTSVEDSGLLDALLPPFTQKTGIVVRTVAVGTGAALRMGAEGNADILLTHAPSRREGAAPSQRPFETNRDHGQLLHHCRPT